MDNKQYQHLTYSKFNDMMDWCYNIHDISNKYNLNASEERSVWLAEITSSVLTILPGFARPKEISISTDSKGDNSFVLETITTESLQQMDQFLRNTQDVADIGIFVDLLCSQVREDNSLEEFSVYDRCWIVIDNNFSECNLIYLEQAPASIRLAIGTDIYSPFTISPLRDNRTLAALNGPRLRSFLQRLHDILSLTLADMDDHGYKKLDLVDEYGFKMPSDPAALERRLQS